MVPPRRLAVVIEGLPQRQPDREEEVKGPPAKAAFKDGQPTKAAVGFAKSRGVDLAALEVRETDKGPFVFVQQTIPGQVTADILQTLIPQWIFGLEGKRFMRWGDGDVRFPRPIRWLVALLDDALLNITLENGSETCTSDRIFPGASRASPRPHCSRFSPGISSGFAGGSCHGGSSRAARSDSTTGNSCR